ARDRRPSGDGPDHPDEQAQGRAAQLRGARAEGAAELPGLDRLPRQPLGADRSHDQGPPVPLRGLVAGRQSGPDPRDPADGGGLHRPLREGSSKPPGLSTARGSSLSFAARSASAKDSGRWRSYQGRWSRPTAWWWVIVPPPSITASDAAALISSHCSTSP